MTTQFIPEIWAEETAEATKFLEGFLSGVPEPPHRRRFLWWHRHFCSACRDYQRNLTEAWSKVMKGQTLNIPRFDMLN